MTTGLAVYALDNAKAVLEEQAGGAGIPWALVKRPLFDFVELLRGQGILLLEAVDAATANTVQEALVVDGKNYFLAVCGDQDGVTILRREVALEAVTKQADKMTLTAQLKLLNTVGMAALGGSFREIVLKFMGHLYANNIFLGAAGPGSAKLLLEKTQGKCNVYLRIKTPQTQES